MKLNFTIKDLYSEDIENYLSNFIAQLQDIELKNKSKYEDIKIVLDRDIYYERSYLNISGTREATSKEIMYMDEKMANKMKQYKELRSELIAAGWIKT